jgi:hypothetical protein
MEGARLGEECGPVTPLCAPACRLCSRLPFVLAHCCGGATLLTTSAMGERLSLIRSTFAQVAVLLALALALRAYTFGDPNLFIDEAFYFAAGDAMHHGAVPYVDVWDRKPFGLFALAYLIAGLSSAPAAYQIAATLFAVLTAFVIGRIVNQWSRWSGGLGAGIAYLFLISAFQGFGGQTPVFYNLLIALAALLVVRSLPNLREGTVPHAVPLAMLSAGLAITIKTTAVFEAAFLGLYAVIALPSSERLRRGPVWAVIGAAPTLAIMAGYALIGHWSEYWQAMTGANLSAERWEAYSAQIRLRLMLFALAPILALAAFGWLELKREGRHFAGLWIVAAMVALAAFPYFHSHYALPLLVPLCVTAGAFFARQWIGPLALVGLCALTFTRAPPIDRSHTERSIAAMGKLTSSIRAHGAERGLFVYEGPPFLYTLAQQSFPSPLAFPAHLYHSIEKDVSHLATLGEVERVIAAKPGVVVMTKEPRDGPINADTFAAVSAYVQSHCVLVAAVETPERLRADHVLVWGDCR